MTLRPWTVTSHDAIVEHESNLWSVSGDVPGMGGMNRRMTIARLADGRLVFFNAVPLDDASMTKINAWGKPWLLVVPHHSHMIDAHAFQEKLGLTTCAPDTELPAVHKRVPSAVGYSTVKLDDTMTLKSFQSTKLFEGYLVVKSGEKQTAVFSDVVMNVPSGRLMFKLLGLSGGAKVPFLQRFLFITNTELLKQELNAVADAPGFGRVIVTHGDVIDSDAPAALKRIIATA